MDRQGILHAEFIPKPLDPCLREQIPLAVPKVAVDTVVARLPLAVK